MNREKFENLTNWIIENGGYVHPHICIRGDGEIIVNGEYDAETILFRIPKKCIISGSPSQICAKLVLEINKGKKSFFSPFLDCLPNYTDQDSHPLLRFDRIHLGHIEKICPPVFKDLSDILYEIEGISKMYNGAIDPISIRNAYILYKSLGSEEGIVPLFGNCKVASVDPMIKNIGEERDSFLFKGDKIERRSPTTRRPLENSVSQIYLRYGKFGGNLQVHIELPRITEEQKDKLKFLNLWSEPMVLGFSDTNLFDETIRKALIIGKMADNESEMETERNAIKFLLQVLETQKFIFYDERDCEDTFLENIYLDIERVATRYNCIVDASEDFLKERWLKWVK